MLTILLTVAIVNALEIACHQERYSISHMSFFINLDKGNVIMLAVKR